MLAAAGCGDDEEPTAGTTATPPPPATTPLDSDDVTGTATVEEQAPPTSPEDQPGGAGDEEAARNEVVLEFSEDGLSPRRVQVAPFIAVRLIVRSDGTEYNLSYTGPVSAGGAAGDSEADFDIDGLRPGQEIEVVERKTDSRAVIVASDAVGP